MKQLFLYGDVSNNFEKVSKPFIQASGGPNAKIALLLQGGPEWEKYIPRYHDPWIRQGAKEVLPIVPTIDFTLEDETFNTIKDCTGIFIAGGDTRTYHRVYASEKTRFLIRSLYEKGIPYGGVSAGAILAPEKCTLQGGVFITSTNEYFLRAKPLVETMKDIDLILGHGIGLIKDCIIEPHFSEWGGFPRLVQSMELSSSTYGFGIDEAACLEIQDGSRAMIHGNGRVYFVVRTGLLEFNMKVLDPGEMFDFKQ